MAEGARTVPHARKATEAELVAEIADQVDFHGYKVIKHTVSVDHEKSETRLNVSLLKGNPDQKVLDLKGAGKEPDKGDGEE